MAYKFYRHTVEVPLLSRAAGRALGEAGGAIVRVDTRDGRTEVTVAFPAEGTLPAGTALGAGVEVSEDDVRTFGG
jgi:hypothetical protein